MRLAILWKWRTMMRILRILEYVGDEESIKRTLKCRAVKGEKDLGDHVIREGFVGDILLLGISRFDVDREPKKRQRGIVHD